MLRTGKGDDQKENNLKERVLLSQKNAMGTLHRLLSLDLRAHP